MPGSAVAGRRALALGLRSRGPSFCRGQAWHSVAYSQHFDGLRRLANSAQAAFRSSPSSSSADHSHAAPTSVEKTDKLKNETVEEEKKSSTDWSQILMYVFGTAGGLTFLYYFCKTGCSLHQTEIAIVQALRRLPFHSPPRETVAEINGAVNGEGLPPDIVLAFSEWFVAVDVLQSEGVTRDDVLELILELGFREEAKACQRYLDKGEGTLEERRRLSATGLQEAMSLLAELARQTPSISIVDGVEVCAECSGTGQKTGWFRNSTCESCFGSGKPLPDPRELLGPAAVALLRKKVRSPPSLSENSAALQQALSVPDHLSSVVAAAPQAKDGDSTDDTKRWVASSNTVEDDDAGADDPAHNFKLEDARLQRLEESLVARRESCGSLSEAQEARLHDIRAQRSKLNMSA